ncbi:MAG: hypothetical protein PUG48_10160 [Clostridia bacterium]|nr:hypothetical protein [Clostridia bacterium]
MSLFDRRTDTEKELDAYRNSHPTNEQQDRYNYGNENYNNSQNTNNNINTTNTYRNTQTNVKNNKKHTVANVIIAILVVLLIGSFAGMFFLADMGKVGWIMVMFGQTFFLFGMIGFVGNIKSAKKSVISYVGTLIFSVVGLLIAVSGFLNEFSDGQTMEYLSRLMSGKLVAVLLCSVFIIIGAVVCISANVKHSKKKSRCNVSVTAEIIDVKVSKSTSDGHTTRHYAPVYRYYYGGTEYIQESDVYLNQRIMPDSQVEIFINPNDVNDIYEPQRMSAYTNTSTMIGVFFVIMGIVALTFAIRGV